MCYYNASLFLVCGHLELSDVPIADCRCPHRDAQAIHPDHKEGAKNVGGYHQPKKSQEGHASLPSPPATPPPITDCQRTSIHPLHTFRVKSLCPECQEERDARIEAFENQMREDLERRILARSAEWNERGTEVGRRRLFRASTTLAMIMEAPITAKREQPEEAWECQSQADTQRSSPASDSMGKMMDGFRRRVGWNQWEISPTKKGQEQSTGDLSVAVQGSPLSLAGKLSFAAFGAASEGKQCTLGL
ncbi:hypothetical protein A1O7_10065 [Cladophialophora yegresii CBS 114405]|uniref:Uncharacterized protein n=1 Tax=Cladophialophora yegresii CBS 114405 TaxID=1182544 RepID=W9W852_9EURO|nr:uncharacterized protein A1O7_10065 [Cladophialophora yegresii CBS 114405]EXJ54724.1 hypothetical protein A1O7_10065 [Cladophialophora yegresii CBS 114405]